MEDVKVGDWVNIRLYANKGVGADKWLVEKIDKFILTIKHEDYVGKDYQSDTSDVSMVKKVD